jgi:uncharacterized membrane protein
MNGFFAEMLKGRFLGHPLHPIFAHLPMALWPAALVFDLLVFFGAGGNPMVRTAFFAILGGLIAALPAVPAGVIDWGEIKKERPAWKLGLYHMMLNLLATILWAINFGLRLGTFREAAEITAAQLTLSVLGTLIVVVSGYLGGLMVFDHGVSVARMSKGKWRKRAEAGNAQLPQQEGGQK